MRDLDEVFAQLAKSSFRSQFHLRDKDLNYLQTKGLPTVLRHAEDFIGSRLSAAEPLNDGKQTPFRGHPVFVAQHATACCCRSCLEKWHRIPQRKELSPEEQAHILHALSRWLTAELSNSQ